MEKVSCTPEDKSACNWTSKTITSEKNVEENGATLLEITTEEVEFCTTCEKIGETLSSNSETYLNYRDTH